MRRAIRHALSHHKCRGPLECDSWKNLSHRSVTHGMTSGQIQTLQTGCPIGLVRPCLAWHHSTNWQWGCFHNRVRPLHPRGNQDEKMCWPAITMPKLQQWPRWGRLWGPDVSDFLRLFWYSQGDFAVHYIVAVFSCKQKTPSPWMFPHLWMIIYYSDHTGCCTAFKNHIVLTTVRLISDFKIMVMMKMDVHFSWEMGT